MNVDINKNYQLVSKAIKYLEKNYQAQPSLEQISQQLDISPYHFQRVFSEWAGVSPKKFLQYLTVEHAKSLLDTNTQASVLDVAYEVGLSSGSRIHDLFVNIEGMTPSIYKSQGAGLVIHYQWMETIFGEVLIASTEKGLCYLGFVKDIDSSLNELQQHFIQARFIEVYDDNGFHAAAVAVINGHAECQPINLHLKGTPFQLKVWEALLKIPQGELSTYSSLAKNLGKDKAARAVGSAIGKNPIAFLIPCHRVIRQTGVIGEYRWGHSRKAALLGWEAAQSDK